MEEFDRYDEVCKGEFERMREADRRIEDKIDRIHTIVTNGLTDKVNRNRDDLKKLDARLWFVVTGIIASIAVQIVLFVVR